MVHDFRYFPVGRGQISCLYQVNAAGPAAFGVRGRRAVGREQQKTGPLGAGLDRDVFRTTRRETVHQPTPSVVRPPAPLPAKRWYGLWPGAPPSGVRRAVQCEPAESVRHAIPACRANERAKPVRVLESASVAVVFTAVLQERSNLQHRCLIHRHRASGKPCFQRHCYGFRDNAGAVIRVFPLFFSAKRLNKAGTHNRLVPGSNPGGAIAFWSANPLGQPRMQCAERRAISRV